MWGERLHDSRLRVCVRLRVCERGREREERECSKKRSLEMYKWEKQSVKLAEKEEKLSECACFCGSGCVCVCVWRVATAVVEQAEQHGVGKKKKTNAIQQPVKIKSWRKTHRNEGNSSEEEEEDRKAQSSGDTERQSGRKSKSLHVGHSWNKYIMIKPPSSRLVCVRVCVSLSCYMFSKVWRPSRRLNDLEPLGTRVSFTHPLQLKRVGFGNL